MAFPNRRNRFIPICALLIMLAACGYHPGAGPVVPASFGTVAVPMFVNESSEPNIQAVITGALIEQLNQAGAMVVDKEEADKILEGHIISYSNSSVARTSASTVSEYRLSAIIHLVLKDRKGKILYENPSAQLREEYYASSILELNEQAESQALESGAVDFAEDEVRHMLDGINAGLGNDNL